MAVFFKIEASEEAVSVMNYFVNVTGSSLEQLIADYDLLMCSIRPSRIKAKHLAIAEMFFVLSGLGCLFIINGPLGDKKGLISFFVRKNSEGLLKEALKNVGYCDKFFLLEECSQKNGRKFGRSNKSAENEIIWKGMLFRLKPFFKQCHITFDEQSPHNREFFIYSANGTVKRVVGYRGDGSMTGKRALPVEDTRLMINLAAPHKAEVLMDPFAGSGGILHTARYINPSLFLISSDIDPILEPGLRRFSDKNFTMDARKVRLKNSCIDAIVTEVPFNKAVTEVVSESFLHLSCFLKKNARIIFMCADYQYKHLRECMKNSGLFCFMEKSVNRKGMSVIISAWYKAEEKIKRLQDLSEAISRVY